MAIYATGLRRAELARLKVKDMMMSFTPPSRSASDCLTGYEPPDDTPAVLAGYGNGDKTLDPLRDFTEARRHERARAVQTI
jgi:hypothetical protein